MATVTLSPKYQVVIPKEVRGKMKLQPGMKFQVFQFEGRIELVPVESARELLGFAKGIDTHVDRDDEDRV